MAKKNNNQVWVSPDNGQWKIKQPTNNKASKICETKKEAISEARKIAQNQGKELVVQNKDGKISQKDSHGRDPRDIKG